MRQAPDLVGSCNCARMPAGAERAVNEAAQLQVRKEAQDLAQKHRRVLRWGCRAVLRRRCRVIGCGRGGTGWGLSTCAEPAEADRHAQALWACCREQTSATRVRGLAAWPAAGAAEVSCRRSSDCGGVAIAGVADRVQQCLPHAAAQNDRGVHAKLGDMPEK